MSFLAVFVGGGLGALSRYCLTLLSLRFFSVSIYGTFFVNILGCMLIGYILGVVSHKADFINPLMKTFLTVGLLGGLTTFSTFSWETFALVKDGKFFQALIYVLISIGVGFAFTYLGFLFSK